MATASEDWFWLLPVQFFQPMEKPQVFLDPVCPMVRFLDPSPSPALLPQITQTLSLQICSFPSMRALPTPSLSPQSLSSLTCSRSFSLSFDQASSYSFSVGVLSP